MIVRPYLLAVCLAALGCAVGCSAAPPAEHGAAVRQAAQGAYTGSVLLLRAVDEVAFRWQESVKEPNPTQLETSRQIRDAVELGRAALAKAKPCIEAGGSCVEELGKFVEQARTVAALLSAMGVNLPDEVRGVLEFVSGYAGRGES